jgi:hypothetical protein
LDYLRSCFDFTLPRLTASYQLAANSFQLAGIRQDEENGKYLMFSQGSVSKIVRIGQDVSMRLPFGIIAGCIATPNRDQLTVRLQSLTNSRANRLNARGLRPMDGISSMAEGTAA